MEFIDAQGAAEVIEDPATMFGHVEAPDLAMQAVVDEAVGEVEQEIPLHRGDDTFDAHAVVEDAVEDGLADLVVVQRAGFDPWRRGPEGGAAIAAGAILAVGDVEEDDFLVGEGADRSVADVLARRQLATGGARGLSGTATDVYGSDVGTDGLHGLRAPVGAWGSSPPVRRP